MSPLALPDRRLKSPFFPPRFSPSSPAEAGRQRHPPRRIKPDMQAPVVRSILFSVRRTPPPLVLPLSRPTYINALSATINCLQSSCVEFVLLSPFPGNHGFRASVPLLYTFFFSPDLAPKPIRFPHDPLLSPPPLEGLKVLEVPVGPHLSFLTGPFTSPSVV